MERNVNLGLLGSIFHSPLADKITKRPNNESEVKLAQLNQLNKDETITVQGQKQEGLARRSWKRGARGIGRTIESTSLPSLKICSNLDMGI